MVPFRDPGLTATFCKALPRTASRCPVAVCSMPTIRTRLQALSRSDRPSLIGASLIVLFMRTAYPRVLKRAGLVQRRSLRTRLTVADSGHRRRACHQNRCDGKTAGEPQRCDERIGAEQPRTPTVGLYSTAIILMSTPYWTVGVPRTLSNACNYLRPSAGSGRGMQHYDRKQNSFACRILIPHHISA